MCSKSTYLKTDDWCYFRGPQPMGCSPLPGLATATWVAGQLLCSFYVKHLIVKGNVRSDFWQDWTLGCPCKEECFINLYSPAAKSFQHSGSRAGSTPGCRQLSPDWRVQLFVPEVEPLLEPSKVFHETFQRTLCQRYILMDLLMLKKTI